MNKLFLIFFVLSVSVFANATHEFLSEEESLYLKEKKVIYASNEFDYEPYDFFNKEASGYSIDILNLLAKKLGLEVKYVTKSWSELLEDVKSQKIDLVHTAFKTQDRLNEFKFSKGYLKVFQKYIIHKDSPDITSIQSLYGKKVGVTKDWAEDEYFSKFPQIQRVYFKNINDKLKALSLKEIDVIAEDENIARFNIIKNGYRDIQISNSILDDSGFKANNLHFITSKNNTHLISILDKTYNQISIEDIQKIREKWFGYKNENNFLQVHEKQYLEENVFNVYVGNWEPFTIQGMNKTANPKGMSVEIWEDIAKTYNIKFKYIQYNSFHEALDDIKNDPYGVHLATAPTKAREEFAYFTKPYESYPVAIVTGIDKNFMSTLDNLKGKKIAVGKNFTAHKILKNNHEGIEYVFVNNTLEALDLVANQKVYGAADILPVIVNSVTNYHYHTLKVSGTTTEIFQLSMMANKQSEQFIKILNKIIDNLDATYMKDVNNRWLSQVKYTQETNYLYVYVLASILFISIVYFLYSRHNLLLNLQHEKDRFDLVIEGTNEGIFDWDIQSHTVYYSPQWKKLLGFENKELKNTFSIFEKKVHPSDLNMVMVKIDNCIKNKIDLFEAIFRMEHKSGKYIWINAKAKISFDEDNNAKRMVGSHSDISELVEYRAQLEEKVLIQIKEIRKKDMQLIEQSKMASMGQMIGNIAHQWRQPLTLISTLSTGSIFEKDIGKLSDEKFVEHMNTINDQAQYLSKTIDTFRDFIKEKKEYQNLVIQERIDIALGIIKSSLEQNYIVLVNNIDYEHPISARVRSGELVEVIINIINNAKDTLIENNTKEPWIKMEMDVDDVNVNISIEDNGGGIPLDVMPKIFEPYFTTKHESQGTGLGLHMAYKIIVEHHQGKLYAKNTDNGAKFFIMLPLIKE